MRLRRSELAVPASNPRMVEKSAGSSADLVFLDLEDAVSPDKKEGARQIAHRRPERNSTGEARCAPCA